MNDVTLVTTAVTHQVYAACLATARTAHTGDDVRDRDRGAVSLEQVLWFVAAGVSVAVIATILWNQIRDQANTPIDEPEPPTP